MFVEAVEGDLLLGLDADAVVDEEGGEALAVDKLDTRVDPLCLHTCSVGEPRRRDETPRSLRVPSSTSANSWMRGRSMAEAVGPLDHD